MYSIIHHGAVSGVTGSCHQFKLNSGESLLVDCGMFQGAEAEARSNESGDVDLTVDFDLSGVKAPSYP